MSESFAWTHRNKLGFGLELRSPAGAQVFSRLVAEADAVFANFKPGTLTGLGFTYDSLREINPAVVLAESSAYGDTGPWSARMGYGPLVRAGTGVTRLWTAPPGPEDAEQEPGRHRFFDATTVFPDHVVGRITAIGALAALIHRDRTGSGARIHVSQAEACVSQLDTVFVTEGARSNSAALQLDTSTDHGVYPCAGDDEWCVVSLVSDADVRAVEQATGGVGLAEWTARLSATEVADTLQSLGVAAAPMQRRMELLEDPQLVSRGFFQPMEHPLFAMALPSEAGPAPFGRIPRVPTRPAPLPGQDTRDVCLRILGLDAPAIDGLFADGVLFSTELEDVR